ncbi:hypothetical protein ACQ5SK_21400 [Bradyrhizobium japonicum]
MPICPSACAVLDHQALLELGSDQGLERTDDGVGAAAGREGHDDLDQLLRIGRLDRLQRQHNESRGRQRGQDAAPCNVKQFLLPHYVFLFVGTTRLPCSRQAACYSITPQHQ